MDQKETASLSVYHDRENGVRKIDLDILFAFFYFWELKLIKAFKVCDYIRFFWMTKLVYFLLTHNLILMNLFSMAAEHARNSI